MERIVECLICTLLASWRPYASEEARASRAEHDRASSRWKESHVTADGPDVSALMHAIRCARQPSCQLMPLLAASLLAAGSLDLLGHAGWELGAGLAGRSTCVQDAGATSPQAPRSQEPGARGS